VLSVGIGIGGGGGGGPGLFRSRSLPHLSGNDSGAGGSTGECPDGGNNNDVGSGGGGGGVGGRGDFGVGGHLLGGANLPGGHCSKSQPAGLSGLGDVRQLVTLKQHYYPEGGWGWVVAAVAVAAHLLTHGLHLASGVFVQELVRKFGPDTVVPAGTVMYTPPQNSLHPVHRCNVRPVPAISRRHPSAGPVRIRPNEPAPASPIQFVRNLSPHANF